MSALFVIFLSVRMAGLQAAHHLGPLGALQAVRRQQAPPGSRAAGCPGDGRHVGAQVENQPGLLASGQPALAAASWGTSQGSSLSSFPASRAKSLKSRETSQFPFELLST